MDGTTRSVGFEAADVGAMLRRRWWVILLLSLLGIAAAAGALQISSRTYSASTSVLVTPTGAEQIGASQPGKPDAVLNLETEAQILRSATVAARARVLLSSTETAEQLSAAASVTVPPNTTILVVTFESPTASGAQLGARAFAKAYLDIRAENAKAALADQVKLLEARIATLTSRLQAVTGQLTNLAANSPDRVYAEAQQRILIDQISQASADLSPLSSAEVQAGRVLTDAQRPTAPVSPVVPLYLAAGLVLGLVLGIALVLVLERTDNRVRKAVDVERFTEVPLLGEIPIGQSGLRQQLASVSSPTGQAFGQVRNTWVAAIRQRPAALLVAGVASDSTNSMVAANLAAALARAGGSVVLVCADPARSTAAKLLEVRAEGKGLSEAIIEGTDPAELLVEVPNSPGLRVLTPGLRRAAALDQLQTRRMEELVATLRGDHRTTFIVVEAPSTASGAEAQAMARFCDSVVLTAELSSTRREAVLDGARQIERVGTPLLGMIVVTGRQPRASEKSDRPSERESRPTRGERKSAKKMSRSSKKLRSGQLPEAWVDGMVPGRVHYPDEVGDASATSASPQP